jgi:hypothetical protein
VGPPPSDTVGVQSNDDRWSPSEEEIRHRAYQRYLERGGGDGMDFEDWLDAERELKATRSQGSSLKPEV